MGIDFEIVAYRGTPLSVDRLAKLIARYTPYAELFRHASAANVKSPLAPDLHMIAFYDDERGGGDGDDDDDNGDDGDDGDSKPQTAAPPPKRGLFISESALAAARESAAQGGSLADVVRQAWSLARGAVRDMPPAPPAPVTESEPGGDDSNCAELARELSRGGEAFLLGYGDHSGTGIYAQFRDGALVVPASVDDIYGERDDYTSWPSQQWSRALGKKVDLDKVVARYFPKAKAPPLHRVERPERAIPFDADRYSMGISESM